MEELKIKTKDFVSVSNFRAILINRIAELSQNNLNDTHLVFLELIADAYKATHKVWSKMQEIGKGKEYTLKYTLGQCICIARLVRCNDTFAQPIFDEIYNHVMTYSYGTGNIQIDLN